MLFPNDLKYTSEHEWVRIEGDLLVIGITDFAQRELDELVYVEVDTVGEKLEKDEVFGTVEAVKTTSELFMPVAGEVVEFNEALSDKGGDDPTLINQDPYGNGWIVKVRPNSMADVAALMDAAAYEALVG